jgi:hypothetical protein
MTDNETAIGLYQKFMGAKWWPVLVFDPDEGWTNWGDRVRDSVAIAAIGWAMVEFLGMFTLAPHKDGGWLVIPLGVHEPTRFQALAAAVEAKANSFHGVRTNAAYGPKTLQNRPVSTRTSAGVESSGSANADPECPDFGHLSVSMEAIDAEREVATDQRGGWGGSSQG